MHGIFLEQTVCFMTHNGELWGEKSSLKLGNWEMISSNLLGSISLFLGKRSPENFSHLCMQITANSMSSLDLDPSLTFYHHQCTDISLESEGISSSASP